jgi:acyl-[acyl-carrier-protein]-phospholipid O-acyltransferase/long-chain-fatty-acid--[acyl-carrier-protein] ligase
MVSLDDQGFITIRGRAKRFAKIAGEMVSLTAVETQVSALWVQHQHAVVAIKDEKKGEQLVLFTTNPDANRAALAEDAKSKGISALSVPAVIKVVDAIPLLGTGKTDYATIQKMAEA